MFGCEVFCLVLMGNVWLCSVLSCVDGKCLAVKCLSCVDGKCLAVKCFVLC